MELTPQVQHQICSAIRSGGFAHVAAASAGVAPRLFKRWFKRGLRRAAAEPYRSFAAEVRQAIAQARLAAEIAAFKKEPKAWLEHGPGKETPNSPGWTGVVPACTGQEETRRDVFAQPELVRLFHELLDALADFPEARMKAAAVLHTNCNFGVTT